MDSFLNIIKCMIWENKDWLIDGMPTNLGLFYSKIRLLYIHFFFFFLNVV